MKCKRAAGLVLSLVLALVFLAGCQAEPALSKADSAAPQMSDIFNEAVESGIA